MKDRSFPAQGDSKADELDTQEAVEGKAVGDDRTDNGVPAAEPSATSDADDVVEADAEPDVEPEVVSPLAIHAPMSSNQGLAARYALSPATVL